MKTAADPAGTTALGTWNNCGNGRTPWGTYLACEENFNGYFSSSRSRLRSARGLQALRHQGGGPRLRLVDDGRALRRLQASQRAAPRRLRGGDRPRSIPHSMPKKRSALGRFKHENAEVTLAADGRVVVYLGDDERGEFLYRFVSDGVFVEGGNNADLLEDGSLSVARFADDGSGQWLALTAETTGMASQAEVLHPHAPARRLQWAPPPWTGPNGWRPTRTRPRPTAASPTTRTAASSPTQAAT